MSGESISLRNIIDSIPDDTPGKLELSIEQSLVRMEQREARAFTREVQETVSDEGEREAIIDSFVDRVMSRTIDASDIDFPPSP